MKKTTKHARKATRHQFAQAQQTRPELLYRNPIFRAMMPKTMHQAQQVNLSLAAREAFESVQRGTACSDDRETLAGTSNVVMVLAEKHCAPDDLEAAFAAQAALLRADVRVLEGKRWNFDGEGRLAIIAMLDAHEQMLAAFGGAELTDALMTVMQRQAGGRVHRIERNGVPV